MFHQTREFASAPIGQARAEYASQHDDHVWRFRNEQAGDHTFARRHWSTIRPRYEYIDINAMDETDPMHFRGRMNGKRKLTDDKFDYSQFSAENGDGEIY